MPLIEIKSFNAVIDNKHYFDRPLKNEQEANEKTVEKSRNSYHTTGILLHYSYYQTIINSMAWMYQRKYLGPFRNKLIS